MDPENRPIIEATVAAYRRYWTAVLQSAEPIWSQLDLTILQLKGLILLEVRDKLTIGGIADGLGIGRPSASIIVEQLVQLGLTTRVEDTVDRRRSLVGLSDEGRELVARLHRGDEQYMESMFACLCEDELAALTQGLDALTGAILASRQ
ncbi:MAG: transcriptional regulator, MarR family [Chloroflexi bacterium]|jgi:DNA-binding MarR family transcriptional regulator|nr:transcriptional regulator, MarR family [Chloroflexota bacterium]